VLQRVLQSKRVDASQCVCHMFIRVCVSVRAAVRAVVCVAACVAE